MPDGLDMYLGWLALLSGATFVGSLLVIPWLVIRIPCDYFVLEKRRPGFWAQWHPLLRLVLVTLKNMLGLILIMAGVVMLILPGQGLLTILLGVVLMNFPGKYRLERFLISRPPVLRALNWIRFRAGAPELTLDSDAGCGTGGQGRP